MSKLGITRVARKFNNNVLKKSTSIIKANDIK